MSFQVQNARVSARDRRLRKHKAPSQAEAERRMRHGERDRQVEHEHHRDHVLTFHAWCQVNGFSKATGRRIIASGNGPPVLQLSTRRIGIKESANAVWQAARAR